MADMQLTLFTDYALRMLMYLGVRGSDDVVTIQEISDAYGVSRHYLLKVANELSHMGYIDASRGRSGGIRLSTPLASIRLGELVRRTEPDRGVLDCVGQDASECAIHAPCRLRSVLDEAQGEFYRVLDRYTVADLVAEPGAFAPLLGIRLRR